MRIAIPRYVKQGNDLEYHATLKVKEGTPGLHIFRISLISPEGKEIKYYSDNLKAEEGKVIGKIPLSLNETTGKWKIKIKDVASGETKEALFIVRR